MSPRHDPASDLLLGVLAGLLAAGLYGAQVGLWLTEETTADRRQRWHLECRQRAQELAAEVEVAPGEIRPVCRPLWGGR